MVCIYNHINSEQCVRHVTTCASLKVFRVKQSMVKIDLSMLSLVSNTMAWLNGILIKFRLLLLILKLALKTVFLIHMKPMNQLLLLLSVLSVGICLFLVAVIMWPRVTNDIWNARMNITCSNSFLNFGKKSVQMHSRAGTPSSLMCHILWIVCVRFLVKMRQKNFHLGV